MRKKALLGLLLVLTLLLSSCSLIVKDQALDNAYPVITMGEQTNPSTKRLLLGQNPDPDAAHAFSIETQVTGNYPASFVWQFDHDDVVPVENSQMMVKALKENNVPYAYETFPGTIHGAGLGTGTPAKGWLEKAVAFWNDH